MCGIVAVLARPSSRTPPDPRAVQALVEGAARLLTSGSPDRLIERRDLLAEAAAGLRQAASDLAGPPGLRCLISDPATLDGLRVPLSVLEQAVGRTEAAYDKVALELAPEAQEALNASLIGLKDAWWAVARDRLGAAEAVLDLLGGRPAGEVANLDGWWAVQVALASLGRLEVRGRDSAGIHVMVSGHAIEGADREEALRRGGDPLFGSGSVRLAGATANFVYKAAAEIGELGDNVRSLAADMRADSLLARVIEHPRARVTVLAHTRWASVGIISQANAHPVSSEELTGPPLPYVVGALNGDVDNHVELRQSEGLSFPPQVTTDAKVIPAVVGRRMASGLAMDEAFMATVPLLEGSVAVAVSAAETPDRLHLALSGSGQALYVGLADHAFVVASEPYGVVEEADRYVRMDSDGTRGEVMVLDRDGAGTLGGIARRRYHSPASPVPVAEDEIRTAEMTTRDVDRRGFDHFLLKEITEAPGSFRKTLRGRIAPLGEAGWEAGQLTVRLGEDTIPGALAGAVADGGVSTIVVVGQGTAAVAGQAVASALGRCLRGFSIRSMPATELSGFGLNDDMSDTLVIAISQSGTTTDTNRTVDLARGRGAHIVAVVNRRNSDLAAKAHGVLYTSDGRDVEMSVASTKAFYAQVAAGWLLAAGLAERAGERRAIDAEALTGVLRSLQALPDAMEEVLGGREEIGRIAASVAPPRRYWAVVGSGPDRVAASEIRIKLSELCYRSISADTTEDKKHIDLSCEPMVLVCAAGLQGPNADDVAKEVAIYQAHKAVPVVIASRGEEARFTSATEVFTVPATDPSVAFVLSAMAGHLFGYEAALSIDSQARVLRAVRSVVEAATSRSGGPAYGVGPHLEMVGPQLEAAAAPFLLGLRDGSFDGNLEASTAVRLVSLLRYATGAVPLESYESETGKIGTPEAILADLLDALTRAIDELTRPIDAIKHQAKTVTVGISRSEHALFGAPLVGATLAAGAAADTLGYRALRTLAALDEAVAEVGGYTRYRIDWTSPVPTISVVDQGGSAASLPSRTAADPRLRGSKHRAAEEREVTVVRGASDGRTVILVPEAKGTQVTGMTLLHVRFHDHLASERAAAVLSGYRTRFNALSDAVTETEPVFDQGRLAHEPLVDLLTEPVYELARRWRTARPS